jgi:Fanconi anemia group M protein
MPDDNPIDRPKEFVKHKLIRENTIESRTYQANILATAIEKNTLCVLPTGLGKTPIAILLTAKRLESYSGSKILIMAPTRPLVNQHYTSFVRTLNIEEGRFAVITGMIKPGMREEIYKEKQIIFATPQTIRNDLVERRLVLDDFSLLVIDEAHHAIGKYAYSQIADKYRESAKHQRILSLTASPGGTSQKIKEINRNMGINEIEVRSESDGDVTEWVKKKDMQWIYVDLPESFIHIRSVINDEYQKRISSIKKFGLLRGRQISKKDLLSLQKSLFRGLKEGDRRAILIMSFVVQAIKLEHAITILETQGIGVLEKYWKKIREGKSRSDERLAKSKSISNAMYLTNSLFEQGSKHPKIGKLCSIINQQLIESPDSKIIIFANYRESVKDIASSLHRVGNAKPIEFVGQREGMTQKEQGQRLSDFRDDEYNILVCTSIGEEGLDIPSMDLAVFYEPVPSGIRSIQRRGRVGRQKIGKIIVLIARGTKDEAYHWSGIQKEKSMQKTLNGMKTNSTQSSLFKRNNQ